MNPLNSLDRPSNRRPEPWQVLPLDLVQVMRRMPRAQVLQILRGDLALVLGLQGLKPLDVWLEQVLADDDLVWGHFLLWNSPAWDSPSGERVPVRYRSRLRTGLVRDRMAIPSALQRVLQATHRVHRLALDSPAERRLAAWLVHLQALGMVRLAWRRRVLAWEGAWGNAKEGAWANGSAQNPDTGWSATLMDAQLERERLLTPALQALLLTQPKTARLLAAALEMPQVLQGAPAGETGGEGSAVLGPGPSEGGDRQALDAWELMWQRLADQACLARLITARRMATLALQGQWLQEMQGAVSCGPPEART